MAFAVLYLPLVREFGASHADVASIQATVLLINGMAGPVMGFALDRLGARRLIQAGAVLVAGGLVAASSARSLPALAAAYGVVGGFGLAALGSQVNMVIAAQWYPAARGRAIAVADLGTGFGAFCFIPAAQALASRWGWRVTLLAWAALLLAVVVPANALQRLPEDHRRPAVGDRSTPWTLARAVRAEAFWWLAAMRFFSACAFPLMNTHAVAYAIGQGVEPGQAAAALGSVSLVSLGGRLATGWLADRIGRAQTLSLTYASATLGIGSLALLAVQGSPWWLAGYVVFFGLAQGSSGIVASARAADVFSGGSFGTIFGWLSLAIGPGEALGAWAGGVVYDRTGSYLGAFGGVVLALAAGLGAIWRVRPGGRR
jgi:MFS family permease